MEISQIVAGYTGGDAISNEAYEMQKLFRSWGYKSEIYVNIQYLSPELRGACKDYRQYLKNDSPDNIIIFHFSVGSHLTDFVRGLRSKKVVIYHNITPAQYYQGIDPQAAESLAKGREELKAFADVPDLALGDSDYNRCELEELGYRNTAVLPLLLNLDAFDTTRPDEKIARQFEGNTVNLIFVGRIAPNKKIEDVIKSFFIYQKTCEPNSRLFLVGGYNQLDLYYAFLCGLIRELDVRNVWFSQHCSFSELVAYYRLSNVFLSMSEHEGFGIPVVESMHLGIPVIAYDAAAVKETMGGAGILVKRKDFNEIAEMIDTLINDEQFRTAVIEKQKRRVEELKQEKIASKLKEFLKPWLQKVNK